MYDNVKGKFDKWVAFWTEVANRTGQNKRVLGYELSNKPFAGDFYAHPLNMLPWLADRDRLQRVFDKLALAIRKLAPEQLIFFESVTWEVTGYGERYGFDRPPGGHEYANRSVFSFHNSVCTKMAPEGAYHSWRVKDAQRLKVAAMVTETATSEVPFIDRHADTSIAGFMNWDYKRFGDWTWDNNGYFQQNCDSIKIMECFDEESSKVFTRVYPQAVAGTLKSLFFNASSGDAHFSFVPNYSI
eukprot:TRINITY_DN12048_c0_g1_i4.p1 TRINITY_DN12048_c0_g1~~TRINITY_DN12048_c0_g1_i4.p1  ORF type:complete len:243 (-),score=44.63 TRINITY_DN12048_c0_g1_i4:365-1093(-)